jgi:hypothetical protein
MKKLIKKVRIGNLIIEYYDDNGLLDYLAGRCSCGGMVLFVKAYLLENGKKLKEFDKKQGDTIYNSEQGGFCPGCGRITGLYGYEKRVIKGWLNEKDTFIVKI